MQFLGPALNGILKLLSNMSVSPLSHLSGMNFSSSLSPLPNYRADKGTLT